MARHHLINGIKVPFTAQEESEWHANEAAHAAKQAKEVAVAPKPYVAKRKLAYPQIGDQLDMLWHDIESGRIVADTESANTWFQHIQGIKDEIPLTELKISNSSMEIVISSHNPSEQ